MIDVVGSVLVIQCDWKDVCDGESCWVYYKVRGQKSDHGTIGERLIRGNKFIIGERTERTLHVTHASSNRTVRFVAPVDVFHDVHKKGIMWLDVANSGLGVSVCTDNKLRVWETNTGDVRRTLDGHLFDAYTCRLFPSGSVVLSGGADMQLRIWDAAAGVCGMVLKGHTCTITDTAIVDRGRNVISVSKDKTARLWNCSQGTCIDILYTAESEINCCALTDVSNEQSLAPTLNQQDEFEYCTAGKVLIVGCENGNIQLIDVGTRTVIGSSLVSSPVISVCWTASTLAVVGLKDGRIMKINIMDPYKCDQVCHDSDSEVQCMTSLSNGLLVGRHDGLCQLYNNNGLCTNQLTGSDCDPIYAISHNDDFIFTACRDGRIRKYNKRDLNL